MGDKVITSKDLLEENKQKRLQLNYGAESLAACRPNMPAFLKQANYFAENLFSSARDISLEIDRTKEAKERNQKKVDEIFDLMRQKVNKQEDEVKNFLDKMSPEQQEDALSFWSEVEPFVLEIIQWLMDVYVYMISRISVGCSIEQGAINDLYDIVIGWYVKIFE